MADTKKPVPRGSSYNPDKGALENLHDALSSFLGIGADSKNQPAHGGKSVDSVVDEAVKGVPGNTTDY
jgi:hypothetical protein